MIVCRIIEYQLLSVDKVTEHFNYFIRMTVDDFEKLIITIGP